MFSQLIIGEGAKVIQLEKIFFLKNGAVTIHYPYIKR